MKVKFSLFKFLIIIIVVAALVMINQLLKKGSAINTSPTPKKSSQVEVMIKPLTLTVGQKPVFDIFFNTHTIDLAFAVNEITFLKDEKGRVYKKSLWEGPPAGGHHRRGKLTFAEPLPQTKKITLFFDGFSEIEGKQYVFNL